jgi:hypothetical protein
MAKMSDFPAVGVVLEKRADDVSVVFRPRETTYEIELGAKNYDGPIGKRVEGYVRVSARKVYTVPSGGNFIAPIFGTPRIVQGRVRYLDEKEMVVQAGTSVIVELPADEDAYDLVSGDLTVGSLVNVVVMPGARFELAAKGAAVGK